MPWGLVFVDDTVLGSGQHSPLSIAQADSNIVILAQQIMLKQTQGVGIAEIVYEHGVLSVQLTDHTWQGPFTIVASNLIAPTPHTLGGVFSIDIAAHQFLTSVGLDGTITAAQPEFDDIGGTLSGSQLPAPTPHTLGGVESYAAVAHQFLTEIDTDGSVDSAQPAFTDISGTVAASQLPAPTASTLGGVESIAAVTHNFLTSISTAGVPAQAQPAFSDISGSVAASQLPNPSTSTLGGVESIAAITHNFLTSISTAGVPTQAQPAFTDLVPGPADLLAQTVTQSGGNLAINRSLGEVVKVSLTASITAITISNWPASGTLGKVTLKPTNGGAFTMTGWPSGTIWAGGLAPTLTSGSGKKDVYVLMSDDGGTTIYGSIAGQNYS